MNPLRHHSKQTVTHREIIDRQFTRFCEDYSTVIDFAREVVYLLGASVRINWACQWNSVRNIGKTGIIIATNDRWCVVQITSGKKADRIVDIYRCGDVEDLDEEEKTVKLIESLGLPTYKL